MGMNTNSNLHQQQQQQSQQPPSSVSNHTNNTNASSSAAQQQHHSAASRAATPQMSTPLSSAAILAACQVTPGSEYILCKILLHDTVHKTYKLADEDVESNKSKFFPRGFCTGVVLFFYAF
jgi:(p)ppGpp synthase/HD superfamily hydrolase